MPQCPHAERRDAAIYCRVLGRVVNPLAFPCMTTRYERCRNYKPVEVPARAGEERAAELARAAQAEGVVAEPTAEGLGLTAEGARAESCSECVFYGSLSKLCFLLSRPVGDPLEPPCKKK